MRAILLFLLCLHVEVSWALQRGTPSSLSRARVLNAEEHPVSPALHRVDSDQTETKAKTWKRNNLVVDVYGEPLLKRAGSLGSLVRQDQTTIGLFTAFARDVRAAALPRRLQAAFENDLPDDSTEDGWYPDPEPAHDMIYRATQLVESALDAGGRSPTAPTERIDESDDEKDGINDINLPYSDSFRTGIDSTAEPRAANPVHESELHYSDSEDYTSHLDEFFARNSVGGSPSESKDSTPRPSTRLSARAKELGLTLTLPPEEKVEYLPVRRIPIGSQAQAHYQLTSSDSFDIEPGAGDDVADMTDLPDSLIKAILARPTGALRHSVELTEDSEVGGELVFNSDLAHHSGTSSTTLPAMNRVASSVAEPSAGDGGSAAELDRHDSLESETSYSTPVGEESALENELEDEIREGPAEIDEAVPVMDRHTTLFTHLVDETPKRPLERARSLDAGRAMFPVTVPNSEDEASESVQETVDLLMGATPELSDSEVSEIAPYTHRRRNAAVNLWEMWQVASRRLAGDVQRHAAIHEALDEAEDLVARGIPGRDTGRRSEGDHVVLHAVNAPPRTVAADSEDSEDSEDSGNSGEQEAVVLHAVNVPLQSVSHAPTAYSTHDGVEAKPRRHRGVGKGGHHRHRSGMPHTPSPPHYGPAAPATLQTPMAQWFGMWQSMWQRFIASLTPGVYGGSGYGYGSLYRPV